MTTPQLVSVKESVVVGMDRTKLIRASTRAEPRRRRDAASRVGQVADPRDTDASYRRRWPSCPRRDPCGSCCQGWATFVGLTEGVHPRCGLLLPSAPSPPYRGGALSPRRSVRQPGYLPTLVVGGPWALRPRLTTGLPFSLAHTHGCAWPQAYSQCLLRKHHTLNPSATQYEEGWAPSWSWA
jgi:hypothetical protein